MALQSLRRIYRWRVPPNWSQSDWLEELRAEAQAAAWEAERDFDPTRGVPLRAFVHHRILTRTLGRVRREWRFARHCWPRLRGDESTAPAVDGIDFAESSQHLRTCLNQLPDLERRLIVDLYWEEKTEIEIARMLSVTQPTICRRKQRILEQLRRWMVPARPQRSEKSQLPLVR
jgi:RNA polymerase sigma factor (sigma-70 family)